MTRKTFISRFLCFALALIIAISFENSTASAADISEFEEISEESLSIIPDENIVAPCSSYYYDDEIKFSISWTSKTHYFEGGTIAISFTAVNSTSVLPITVTLYSSGGTAITSGEAPANGPCTMTVKNVPAGYYYFKFARSGSSTQTIKQLTFVDSGGTS